MTTFPSDAAALVLCAIFGACTLVGANEGIPWDQVREKADPLPIRHRTPLVSDGVPAAVIAAPGDPSYESIARQLAETIETLSGVRLPVVPADELVTGPAFAFDSEVMRSPADGGRNLILLGDLTSNRAVARLYVDWYAFEDAVFPGADGWCVRTIVDPQGLGWNAVILGGRGPAEVSAAADAWAASLETAGDGLIAPHMFEVTLGEHPMLDEITRRTETATAWPDAWRSYLQHPDSEAYRTAYGGTTPIQWAFDVLTRHLVYGGLHYAVSGDPAFARMAGEGIDALYENLEWIEANRTATWDAHYMIEIWLRGWQQVANSPHITEQQRKRGHRVMAFIAGQMWIYRGMDRAVPYRILSRHQYSGVFAADALCRWVLKHSALDSEMTRLLEGHRADFRPVIHEMMQTYTTGFDHKWGLDGNWHLLQMAAEEPVPEYVASGLARMNADFATMCINNAGEFVNFGAENIGAVEGYDAWQILGRAATLTGDGRYQWWLDNRMSRFPYKVFIMSMGWLGHWYHTSLEPVEPTDMIGINRALLPKPLYQDLVDGKGRLYAGTPVANDVALADSFNKITFRDGLGEDDQYLMLDGLGGVTYSGNDANAICEYSRFGTPLLVQYTLKHEPFYQNTCSVSRGNAGDPVGTFASVDEMAQFGAALYTKTTLSPLSGADHTRHLFMEKGGAVVVIDDLTVHEEDEYFLTCNFRGFGESTVDEAAGTWTLARDDASLLLQSVRLPGMQAPELAPSVRTVAVTHAGEEINVQVLRETVAGAMGAGGRYRFANVFTGTRRSPETRLRAVGLPDECVAVLEPEEAIYAAPSGAQEVVIGDLRLQAAAARIAGDSVAAASLRRLAIGREVLLDLQAPVTVDLDLTGGSSRLLAPQSQCTGTIAWEPGWSVEASAAELARGATIPTGESVHIDLVALRRAVREALRETAPTEPQPPSAVAAEAVETGPEEARRLQFEAAPVDQAVRADLTGDGATEVILAREDGHLVALEPAGALVFDAALSDGPLLGLWAGELNGVPVVIATGRDGSVHACDPAGSVLWSYRNKHWGYGGDPVVYSVTVGDFRGDGSQQVALGCHGGVALLAIGEDRPEFVRFTEVYAHNIEPIDTVRLPGEERDWLLLNSRGGGLKLVDPAEGMVVDGWARMWGGIAHHQQEYRINGDLYLVQADFNGIGAARLDAAAWRDGRRDIESLWADDWYMRTDGETLAALVADLDRDDVPEILSGNETGFLVCYSLSGKRLWAKLLGSPISEIVRLPGDEMTVAVAARKPGLTILDTQWQALMRWSPPDGAGVARIWADGENILALTSSGELWRVTPERSR